MQRSKRSSPCDDITLDEDFRPTTCPNCEVERHGAYCHECGQRYLKVRLNGPELWWLFAERFLDWEEGVWRTFLKMATAPGIVVRDFLGGRRKTYLNPFSYLLFCVFIYAVGQFIMQKVAGLSAVPGMQGLQEMGQALDKAENQFTLIAYGIVVAMALLAVTMRLMFDGRLLNAMEAVVTTIYTSGNVVLIALVVSVVEYGWTGDPLSGVGLAFTFALLFPLCLGHVGYGMFQSWGMAGFMAVTPIAAGFLGGFFIVMPLSVISANSGLLSILLLGGVILLGPGLLLLLFFSDLLG